MASRTPCHGRVYDALPPESRMATARLLQPKDSRQRKACVLHLAGTGDHTWSRRMNLGGPLLQQVASAQPALLYRQCSSSASTASCCIQPAELSAALEQQCCDAILGHVERPGCSARVLNHLHAASTSLSSVLRPALCACMWELPTLHGGEAEQSNSTA